MLLFLKQKKKIFLKPITILWWLLVKAIKFIFFNVLSLQIVMLLRRLHCIIMENILEIASQLFG